MRNLVPCGERRMLSLSIASCQNSTLQENAIRSGGGWPGRDVLSGGYLMSQN